MFPVKLTLRQGLYLGVLALFLALILWGVLNGRAAEKAQQQAQAAEVAHRTEEARATLNAQAAVIQDRRAVYETRAQAQAQEAVDAIRKADPDRALPEYLRALGELRNEAAVARTLAGAGSGQPSRPVPAP